MAQNNTQSAISFLLMVSSGKVKEAFHSYAGTSFRHHNPFYPDSQEALMTGMQDSATQFPEKAIEVQHTLEQGDLVAIHSHVILKPGELEYATLHLFRFESSHIVEFWDIGQAIPGNSPNKNGMF